MIEKEKAILVDIRYPTDFAASHIDGAINLSLRRMPTEVMNEHIAKLPKRPIIMPCYDRRGCFFAEVLGYELTKAESDVARPLHLCQHGIFCPRAAVRPTSEAGSRKKRAIRAKSAGRQRGRDVSRYGDGPASWPSSLCWR